MTRKNEKKVFIVLPCTSIKCCLSLNLLLAFTHSHGQVKSEGQGLDQEVWGSSDTDSYLLIIRESSVLPSTFSENYNGTSTWLEGGLDSSHSDSLRGVSGQRAVSSELFKQLSMEGGCLCFSCYLFAQVLGGMGEVRRVTHNCFGLKTSTPQHAKLQLTTTAFVFRSWHIVDLWEHEECSICNALVVWDWSFAKLAQTGTYQDLTCPTLNLKILLTRKVMVWSFM